MRRSRFNDVRQIAMKITEPQRRALTALARRSPQGGLDLCRSGVCDWQVLRDLEAVGLVRWTAAGKSITEAGRQALAEGRQG